MNGRATLKIVPNEMVLAENKRIHCTVPECTSTFSGLSNFQMHLVKHHGIQTKKLYMQDTDVRYYCPVRECKYNVQYNDGAHFFKMKKYVRQHFVKVHAMKTAKCIKCDKAFGNETLKQQHERDCGSIFKCLDCEWTYKSRGCLLTHCRRKGHTIPPKQPLKKSAPKQSAPSISPNMLAVRPISAVKLAPKPTIVELPTEPRPQMVTDVDVAVDYSPAGRIKANFQRIMQKHRQPEDMNVSRTTQTMPPTKLAQASQTTVTHHTLASLTSDTSVDDKYKSLELTDEEMSNSLTDAVQAHRNLNNLNFCEDDSSLQYFTVNNFNVGLCHIETQTELRPFDDSNMESSDLDPLLCHMHTQTTDELLSDLGFSKTQHADLHDYLFVSTETQTCFDQQPVEIISAETQTTNTDYSIPCTSLILSNQCTQTQ